VERLLDEDRTREARGACFVFALTCWILLLPGS
jgi:hypothetical protein